jgi:WD40 repeat protein
MSLSVAFVFQSVIDLVFTPQEVISVSKDGTIAFWDLLSGECTRNIDISAVTPGPNTRLYVSRDGRRLIVDSDAIHSPVYIYDMKTAQLLHR